MGAYDYWSVALYRIVDVLINRALRTDEGHRMKNTQSRLSQTLNQFYSSRYRLILTGTPLQVGLLFTPIHHILNPALEQPP
jgi:hypothetical protein